MRTPVTPLADSTRWAASAPVMPRMERTVEYFLKVELTEELAHMDRIRQGSTMTRYVQSKP